MDQNKKVALGVVGALVFMYLSSAATTYLSDTPQARAEMEDQKYVASKAPSAIVETSDRPGTMLHCDGDPEHKNVAKYGSGSKPRDYSMSSYSSARSFMDLFPGNCHVVRRGPDLPPGMITDEAMEDIRASGGVNVGPIR
jgi:hypothetical protein